ncbi:hypothetical protein D3C80_1772070 [compost metagenome]
MLDRCTAAHAVGSVGDIGYQRVALAHFFDEVDIIVVAGDNLGFIPAHGLDLVQGKMRMLVEDHERTLSVGKNPGCKQWQRRDDSGAA